jgi:hypothetical protein
MGGTLTLLIRYLVRTELAVEGRRIALLYAVNTAGAALGCFLTDFTFVPAIGLLKTQEIAALLNALAAVGAIALARGKSQIPNPKSQTPNRKLSSRKSSNRIPNPESRIPAPVVLTAAALALSGFAGLSIEIVWFRHFSIMLGAFRAVFSLLLTVILVGIGAGSLIAGALQRRASAEQAGAWLLIVQSIFIAATLAGLWLADSSAIDLTVSGDPAFRAAAGATDALVAQHGLAWDLKELWFNLRPMLPEVALPALLMGFSFPLANAFSTDSSSVLSPIVGIQPSGNALTRNRTPLTGFLPRYRPHCSAKLNRRFKPASSRLTVAGPTACMRTSLYRSIGSAVMFGSNRLPNAPLRCSRICSSLSHERLLAFA